MAYLKFYNPYYSANRDESENCACGQVPAANFFETDKEFSIEIALPGVDKKDISVTHDKGYLQIRVEKKEEKEAEEIKYDRREFDYTGTSRVIKTGDRIDAGNITAKYDNGILTLNLPKKEAFVNKPAQEIAIN